MLVCRIVYAEVNDRVLYQKELYVYTMGQNKCFKCKKNITIKAPR